jgi:hypothetical protein
VTIAELCGKRKRLEISVGHCLISLQGGAEKRFEVERGGSMGHDSKGELYVGRERKGRMQLCGPGRKACTAQAQPACLVEVVNGKLDLGGPLQCTRRVS